MPDVATRVLTAYLTDTATVLFTVGSGKKYIITDIMVCNTDGTQRTVDLHHTDAGTAASAANAFLYNVPVKAKQTVSFGRGMVFNDGDKLRGLADVTNKVTVSIYYVERT